MRLSLIIGLTIGHLLIFKVPFGASFSRGMYANGVSAGIAGAHQDEVHEKIKSHHDAIHEDILSENQDRPSDFTIISDPSKARVPRLPTGGGLLPGTGSVIARYKVTVPVTLPETGAGAEEIIKRRLVGALKGALIGGGGVAGGGGGATGGGGGSGGIIGTIAGIGGNGVTDGGGATAKNMGHGKTKTTHKTIHAADGTVIHKTITTTVHRPAPPAPAPDREMEVVIPPKHMTRTVLVKQTHVRHVPVVHSIPIVQHVIKAIEIPIKSDIATKIILVKPATGHAYIRGMTVSGKAHETGGAHGHAESIITHSGSSLIGGGVVGVGGVVGSGRLNLGFGTNRVGGAVLMGKRK